MRTRSCSGRPALPGSVMNTPQENEGRVSGRAKRRQESPSPDSTMQENHGRKKLRSGPQRRSACKSGRIESIPGVITGAGMDVSDETLHGNVMEKPVQQSTDNISKLSLEILCRIMRRLCLRDVIKLEQLSRQLHEAVGMHLRLLTELDFTEGQIYGWMPDKFTDKTFQKFLARCTDVVNVLGLHPRSLAKRRHSNQSCLSIPGIISALTSCSKLKYVETCDIFLLEAILFHVPHVSFKTFKNRNGTFPIPPTNRFELTPSPRITSLHLSGVTIPELPRMDLLKHLHLQWVCLSLPHPFRDFGVPILRTFVMNNCAGPTNMLSYVPLITALAAAPYLNRLELTRVPFLGKVVVSHIPTT